MQIKLVKGKLVYDGSAETPDTSVQKGAVLDKFKDKLLVLGVGSILSSFANNGDTTNVPGNDVFQHYLSKKMQKASPIWNLLYKAKGGVSAASLVPVTDKKIGESGKECFDPKTNRTKKNCDDPGESVKAKRLRGTGVGAHQKGVTRSGRIPESNKGRRGARINV